MQDAFAYCAELVRAADRDRFLASLFAPAEHRGALQALYAFNVEVARVREAAREPLPGEIRLQWWTEVIGGARGEEAGANPVAAALLAAIERYGLPPAKLTALIEARRFDLYDDPMARIADLEAYARDTASGLLAMAAQILGGGAAEQAAAAAEQAADAAGIAYAVAGLLRALPQHAARRQLYVPAEILERHNVEPRNIFARQGSDGLRAALTELQDLARRHLDAARAPLLALPAAALPAYLPIALVRPTLDRLAQDDPFAPGEIAPWRRQWLIWRAARNPARIAR
jgi:15-cis-phytoene synthase